MRAKAVPGQPGAAELLPFFSMKSPFFLAFLALIFFVILRLNFFACYVVGIKRVGIGVAVNFEI